MAKKLIVTIVALIGIMAMVLTGCNGGGGGEPVTIKMLIRSNDLRLEIGDYVAGQLEDLGFTVERQYGIGSELAPIWQGDPSLGEWNVYTGAWINTAVSRDEGYTFGAFFTPLGDPGPLWQAYEPTEEFMTLANALWYNDWATMAEREDMFEEAVPLSLEDSARVFLLDRASYAPLQADIALAADACGGVEGTWMWAPTIHYQNGAGVPLVPLWDGGSTNLTVKVALEDLLVNPWNPVAGSNWAMDQFAIRGTGCEGFEYDTRDGLAWPHAAEKAEVVVLEGLPIGQDAKSAEWLTFSTSEDPIAVPTTAWADWNAVSGEWVNVAPGKTAKTKTVVYYPEGTFGRPLHDGSTLDEGDFLFYAIMQFDRAKADSDIYDTGYVPVYNTFMEHFKGVTFNFTAPGYDLVVTTYDDLVLMDAELIARGNSWFPSGNMVGQSSLGPWTWHNLALGYLAEEDMESAFSKDKATSTEPDIEWMSFISGPSLVGGGTTKGLVQYLDDVLNVANPDYGFIPYPNVIGDYITQGEALTRYTNLKNFYDTYGHLWVASGPYYLKSVDAIGDKLELNAFTNYQEDGDLWLFLVDYDGKLAGQQVPVTPPEHNGPWLDTVTLEIEADHAAGISRLQSADIDIYAAGLTEPDLFETVEADADLHYYLSAGLYDELTFNPVGPFFPETGEGPNPFAIPAIREAMNWAVDRSYIVGEIYGGMAYERYTCVATVSGDYITRYPALFAAAEAEYAYDFAAADAAIEAAMLAINGTTRVAGKYYYAAP